MPREKFLLMTQFKALQLLRRQLHRRFADNESLHWWKQNPFLLSLLIYQRWSLILWRFYLIQMCCIVHWRCRNVLIGKVVLQIPKKLLRKHQWWSRFLLKQHALKRNHPPRMFFKPNFEDRTLRYQPRSQGILKNLKNRKNSALNQSKP